MPTDFSARRPLRALSSADLATFPVWEWALGEETPFGLDASLLRPTSHASVPLERDAQYIVAALADIRNGAPLPACVEVNVVNGRARCEPLFLLVQNRHLDIGGDDTTRVLNQLTRKLNSYATAWQLAVPLGDGQLAPARKVKRSWAVRLGQLWLRLRVAATGEGLLTP